MWFGEEEGGFKVPIGGDGAPFGKWDQSMSWNVSFLNVGPRVASPNDNFLLFGANCKEDHKVVSPFIEKLVSEIEVVENLLCHFVVVTYAKHREFLVRPSSKISSTTQPKL